MPRLTTPTLGALDRSHPAGAAQTALDSLTTLQRLTRRQGSTTAVLEYRSTEGDATLTLIAEYRDPAQPQRLAFDWSDESAVVPAQIVTRVNRTLLDLGMGLQRDWRTGQHSVKYGPRRVLPITPGETVVVTLTPSGYSATSATPAPRAETPDETQPETPEVAPAGERATNGPVVSASGEVAVLPAAYSGEIVLQPEVRKVWQALLAAHDMGRHVVIGFVGPSGAGKTHAVHALGHDSGMPVVKFDASGVVEPGDWFGTVNLLTDEHGNTVTRFAPTDLLDALERPGRRVLLIDEVNRANPRALNALLPVLDGSGSVIVPQTGRRAVIAADVLIAVTANIGSQFLAVEPLDEAVRTRVSAWVEVEHLGETDEAGLLARRTPGLSETDAANLARLGFLIRESATKSGQHPPVSTRQLLAAADMTVGGAPIRLAVEYAVLKGYKAEGDARSERAKVAVHVAGVDWDGSKAKRAAKAEAEADADSDGQTEWTTGWDMTKSSAGMILCRHCGAQGAAHTSGAGRATTVTVGNAAYPCPHLPSRALASPGHWLRGVGGMCAQCGAPAAQHAANGYRC